MLLCRRAAASQGKNSGTPGTGPFKAPQPSTSGADDLHNLMSQYLPTAAAG